MLDSQQLIENPDSTLTGSIPPDEWRQLSRPTIVAVLLTPKGEVLLVQPKKASPHGWIFPQGGIERRESLLEAAMREVGQELGYSADLLDYKAARFVGKAATPDFTGKQYFVVAIPMRRWEKPQLNEENRDWCTVGGVGELMTKIGECSLSKKELIKLTLRQCVEEQTLFSRRWQSAHVTELLQSI